jgi:glyoxylase-like metal-dependent hydrolase (beta-lactamase superfamily II)
VGQVRLPFVQEQRRNGVRYFRVTHTKIQVNSQLSERQYAIPAGLDPDDTPPPELKATAIGKDLYLLRGEYNSLFVVADDHVVVIEAPVNSRRSATVLSEIHRVAPGKPVKYVVSTHFHSDHIGGLRPFIAEGATIVTTPSARQVILDFLIKGSRTRGAPDTLSKAPRAPVIELAGTKRVLGDANHRIEVLDVSPNPHADEILVVWLPGERLLFEGDMLDLLVPEHRPSMPGDDTRALARSIRTLGLDVERIIAVHGRPGTRADLERTLARSDP